MLYLFTDASVNPQKNFGYGSYLIMDETQLLSDILLTDIKSKRFEDTSSTKLELQTLLWALDEIDTQDTKLIIYTDCQNIIGLNNRREKLEKSNYMSKTNKQIKNHILYKKFYKKMDLMQVEFIKVEGS
ncbi:MAG: RNase H family protein [Sulfurimonas sp.]|nr:RNase H family protein [Sulfurimonas sp.]